MHFSGDMDGLAAFLKTLAEQANNEARLNNKNAMRFILTSLAGKLDLLADSVQAGHFDGGSKADE